jgi:beta-N-acetylhexosaminidase
MPFQFMVDIEKTELSDLERTILREPTIGAVILFTRNFENPNQLYKLIQEILAINSELFIATDHEGGTVQRFQRQGFSPLPAARTFGRVFDKNQEVGKALAQEYGEIMARELIAHGIDLSLAPVLDLHTDQSTVIGGMDRAFHTHPGTVAHLAEAFILGMNCAGMPAVGKHYPGHGSIVSDSHVTMPVSQATLDELMTQDLKPFIELINKNLLTAVMPAHVTYEEIDKEHPAGFSKIWLQDILRTKLGFKGLVLSDCLSMKGADIGNLTTRAEKALSAGCDMLIVCHQPRELLLNLVQNLSVVQTPESAKRIALFKKLMLRFSKEKPTYSAYNFYPEKIPQEVTTEHDNLNKTTSV